jgi:DNA-binding transcriptional ArsR family regulator
MLQLTQRALTASEADAKLFVDRDAELATIERALDLRFSVYLSGPAGSGKTSTLHRLQARWRDGAVFVNAARVDTFDDLVAQVAEEIRPVVSEAHVGLPQAGRRAADPLAALRDAAGQGEGDRPSIVLLDGLSEELRHELFGRQRDELWEVPLRWVVAGSSALVAPSDTFFEAHVALEPLGPPELRELLRRRGHTGTRDEQTSIDALAETLPMLLAPTTPRRLLATTRTVLLSRDPDATLGELRRQRNARVHLSDTASRVLDALESMGPIHAGDERLLEEIGTTRSRVAQVLGELEAAGLVVSARDGKRRLYSPSVAPDFTIGNPDSGEVARLDIKQARGVR